MTITLIIAGVTVVGMVASVLVKPYVRLGKVNVGLYWLICLVGAVVMLVCGRLPLLSAWRGITADSEVNPLKILTLFLSMTVISIYLGDAGFFDLCADKIFAKTGSNQMGLFLTLYAVVAVLTVFTSNDIIILTFTPPICVFAKKAGISPLPYLVAEFVAANTWSMMLIVGNPTNIYLASSAGIAFAEYLSVMWLPALLGGLASLGVMLLIFSKKLKQPIEKKADSAEPVKCDKVPLIAALSHLVVCIVLLAISSYIKVEMWLICLILMISLTLFNLVYGIFREKSAKKVFLTLKKAPYELIPFILSMFVIVLALSECGFTELVAKYVVTGTKTDALTFPFLTALCSNSVNNIPAAVLFEKIIASGSIPAVYGAVIGSNVGAYITPVGALAGIMWNNILGEYHVKMNFFKFVTVGVSSALPTLLFAALGLFLAL